MPLHRVPPILKSVALVRSWLVENVPCTDSMLGYDLFLQLGNECAAGQRLTLVASFHPELADFGRLLYDRMHDLGWLYLHNFGSACFLVSSLAKRLAELHGRRARIVSGLVELENQGKAFLLGGPGYAKPGQIDGHAACVIDDTLVLDFGMGNVRKSYRRDFYWGAIVDYARDGAVFARYAPHIDELIGQYVARYR